MRWKYGTGFPVIEQIMNNLALTKKRIEKAERLHAAQLATFKKGVFTSYKSSILKKDKIKLVKKLQQWILKSEFNC